LTALVADGFATTDPVYLMALSLLGASEKVEEFKVGRLALPYTQDMEFTTTSTTEDDVVGFDIIDTDGTEYACYYTVLSGDVAADVAAGVKAAVDAHGLAITIAVPSGAEIQLVADNAGDLFYYHSNLNGDFLMETADPGIATDLAAISVVDDDWYCLLLDHESYAITDAAAGWIETQRKMYLAQSSDSGIPTVATDDIATELMDDSRARTALVYRHAPDSDLSEYTAVGWAGKCLPQTPGSQTWCFKTISGSSSNVFTATEVGYLDAKNANYYMTIASSNIMRYGNVSGDNTAFVDELRLIDWLQATVEENVFAVFTSNAKVPYDDSGIALIRSAIRAAYNQGVNNGALGADDFTFDYLAIADQDAADVSARIFRGIVFGGTFTGAAHEVYITGNMG
jgi:hypothetical protein